jgi:hypothetical protein
MPLFGPYSFLLTKQEGETRSRRGKQRWRSFATRLSWAPTLLALTAIPMVSLLLAILGAISPSGSQVALMFGVASFFLGKWLHQWESERAHAKTEAKWREAGADRLAPTTIAVSETEVTVEARYDWAQFLDVEESADLLWLWMTPSWAAVLPARAFPDAERRAAFATFVRAKINPHKA